MPTIPCDECDETFKNMVQLKRHKLGGGCVGQQASIAAVQQGTDVPTYKFDFFNEGRPGGIETDVWAAPGVAGAHHNAGGLGSLGVHFLNLKDKAGVVVLKQGSPSTATEAFCARLYKALGVTVPSIRVLSLTEWTAMLGALRYVPFTEEGAGNVLQDVRARNAGGTLQTFVRGYTIKDPRTAALFTGADAADLMQQIGGMIAVDMLINNFDRTPLIWNHQGNANNLMFTVTPDGPVLVAIDNTTQPIHNSDGLKTYLDNVKGAVQEAREEKANAARITRVRDFINQWAHVDIGELGSKEIQIGIAEMARKIVSFKDLTRVWEDTFKTFAGVGWGESGMASVELDFIQKVQDVMGDALQ